MFNQRPGAHGCGSALSGWCPFLTLYQQRLPSLSPPGSLLGAGESMRARCFHGVMKESCRKC